MRACITLLIGVLLLSPTVSAQVPQLIRYQGTLVDAQNVPLEGAHDLTFRLYPAATGGSAVWTEAQTGVPISRGVFNVLLGQVTPLELLFDQAYWLSVQVDADGEMSPRQQLTSVPFAVRAKVADALANPSAVTVIEQPRGLTVDTAGTLTQGLMAYWNLEEAGGTRNDQHGLHALTDNNTVTQAAGKIGQAAQFTRINSEYLSVADNPELSAGDIDFTVAAWVYLDSKPGAMSVVIKGISNGAGTEYQLYYAGGPDRFSLFVSNGTQEGAVYANSVGSPLIGTWYFLVAWHDAVANTLNIQVNGGTVDSATYSAGVLDSTHPFEVGRVSNSGDYMHGRIDQIGFWKRVLTTQERADLYNGGNGNTYGPPPPATPGATTVIEQPRGLTVDTAGTLTQGLMAYWNLEEAGGTRNDQHGPQALADNNTVTQNAGKAGSAAQFVRANSEYLSIADNANLSTGDVDFTVAAWVYLDSKPGEMYIIHKGHSGIVNATEYGLRVDGDRFQFFVENGAAGGVVSANSVGSPTAGTWHYVVAWHNATANTLNIVVNNGTVDSSAYAGGGQDTAYSFTIGNSANLAANSWNGRIDEVGFWKRVLTPQERTDLYNAGAGNTYQLGGFFLDSSLTGRRHRILTEELP